jgi:hypothetical protein
MRLALVLSGAAVASFRMDREPHAAHLASPSPQGLRSPHESSSSHTSDNNMLDNSHSSAACY